MDGRVFNGEVASARSWPAGQITLRRIDSWRKIASVLSQRTAVAA